MRLVTDQLTSNHSRRSYRTALLRFFAWVRFSGGTPGSTKALASQYRAHLLEQGLSSATINLQL